MTYVYMLTITDMSDFGKVLHKSCYATRDGANSAARKFKNAWQGQNDDPLFADALDCSVCKYCVRD